jgi:cytochrome c peroxidase
MKSWKILVLALMVISASCASADKPAETPAATTPEPAAKPDPGPLGEMAIPADNPMTPEKVELGKKLFFDKRLSKTGMMSCENCHLPDKGWTDGKAISPRFDGSMNTRHTPTLYNVGFYKQWYWDGRAATLEGQITAAWRSQMGGDPDAMAMMINGVEGYKAEFQKVFNGPATATNIPQALAAFVRTIKSENAPWDMYQKGDKSAVSEDAVKGYEIFSRAFKGDCIQCHVPPLYTDTVFHNVGIGYDKPMPDAGRGGFLETAAKQKNTTDPEAETMKGAFKTPTLRSVTESGPYFHDGRAAKLEEAVDLMAKGGIKNPNLDPKLQPKKLTPEEMKQLMAFIAALTPAPKPFEKPQIP